MTGQPIKQVEEFPYLGSVVTSDGKCMQDNERRRDGADKAFVTLRQRMWGRRKTRLKIKMKVFITITILHLFTIDLKYSGL